MKKHLLTFTLTILCITGGTPNVAAREGHAIQGDIARVEISLSGQHVRLQCFGKSWPVKSTGTGRWKGWIGVDLAQKPGNYPVRWVSEKQTAPTQLHVGKAHFRISRITVKRKMAVFDAKALARIHADQASLRKSYRIKVKAAPDIAIVRRPVDGIVSTPFGARRYVNGEPRSPHSGLDIAAPAGTPIINPLPGRILLAEAMFLNGNTVTIGYGRGLVMVYSHLQNLHVHAGEWLKAGERIGEVGQTGRATGPHLHWGVRFNNARINPDTLILQANSLE